MEFIYRFYIGSNNKTKKTEVKKALKLFSKKVLGFTLINNNLGYWNKEKEKSFIIEVIANKDNPFNDNKAKKLKGLLERDLKQFLVLTTKEKLKLI